ncbi:G protein-coupled glucose receptor regulating Gpa2-domain-containing protein [Xylariaceae sp. FL0662B]|nr:G protein-coupled glucose receptor regulating Gpa2-domain-containing protein [Xylariaceae sp. FL0662B]
MAPFAELRGGAAVRNLASYGAILTKRGAEGHPGITDPSIRILMSISLSTASLSVLAALSAFYWFVRMRRSFRHDLIMLLIQSDMLKALWLVICPLAYFSRVSIDSNTAFCQVSGFLLTVMIEASDIAVLLIAIHTALFILKPQHSSGAAGLHPYRRIAYVSWIVIPIILAAVVPITGGSFEDNGPYCYLPVDPTWYRSAISWIPRYVIFGVIIVTYTWLYLYVAFRFRRFGKDQRRASAQSDRSTQKRKLNHHEHQHDVPPTPPIADHGLLSSARGSPGKDEKPGHPKDRQQSFTSTVSTLRLGEAASTPTRPEQAARRNSIAWNVVDFGQDGSVDLPRATQPAPAGHVSPMTFPLSAETGPLRTPEPVHHASLSSSQPSGHSRILRGRSFSTGPRRLASSISSIFSSLRRGPQQPPDDDASSSTPSSPIHLPAEAEEALRRSRERPHRQLRLLFVYPAIYMLTWIAPFVSHVLRYDDTYADQHRAPLALRVVSIASLGVGAAVDCCFFSAWEKPWLHLRGGFWEGLALRLRVRSRARRRGGGRTGDERFVDARTAQVRRQQENLHNMSEAAAARFRPHQNTPREWWDVVDVESGSSTLRLV